MAEISVPSPKPAPTAEEIDEFIAHASKNHRADVDLFLDRWGNEFVDITSAEKHCNWTAFMIAIDWGYISLASHLLKRGANIDATTVRGDTALMWAVIQGKESHARFLLAHNASLAPVNRDGNNAVTLAMDTDGHPVEGIIRAHAEKQAENAAREIGRGTAEQVTVRRPLRLRMGM